MNKFTVFEWIKKVIDSVENNAQDITSERLIDNFYIMYKDWGLTSDLWLYSQSQLQNWNC